MRFIIFTCLVLFSIAAKASEKTILNTSINELLEQQYEITYISQSGQGENYHFILRKKGKYGYDDQSGDYIKSGEKFIICKVSITSTICYIP